jgi:Dyp-type peroxidase family
MRDGSFQLFLRLTQNVAGWWEAMDRLRAKYGVDIAAKVIGREQDGRPLAPGGGGEDLNDFTYEGDQEGEHTPRFAHIRRANPRDDKVYNDRSHRLLRRGIPFGPFAANQEQARARDEERGLLLNAFMASLEDQFEVVMRRWAGNSGELPVIPGRGGPEAKVSDGPDPLIGANPHPCTLRLQGGGKDELALGRFVHTSGAVYAFAPSISTLRRLGRKEPMREG